MFTDQFNLDVLDFSDKNEITLRPTDDPAYTLYTGRPAADVLSMTGGEAIHVLWNNEENEPSMVLAGYDIDEGNVRSLPINPVPGLSTPAKIIDYYMMDRNNGRFEPLDD